MFSPIISKSKILVALVVVLPILIFLLMKEPDQKPKVYKSLTKLEKFLLELQNRWVDADKEGFRSQGILKCSDIPNLNQLPNEFLQCHPHFLSCVIESDNKEINPLKKFNLKFVSQKIKPTGDMQLEFLSGKQIFSVLLENHCHRTYLPEKIYSAGPRGVDDFVWDNLGRRIFVDKYHVNRDQFARWLGKTDVTEPTMAETSATKKQQQDFCRSRKGFLLESRVLDAASMYPAASKSALVLKSPYPWTKSNRFDPDQVNCENFLYQGCELKSVYQASGLSWLGLFQTLGGPFESVENTFEGRANLKLSSVYLPKDSVFNQLGKRAFWTGQGGKLKNFVFKEFYSEDLVGDIDSKQEYGVAFRCFYLK